MFKLFYFSENRKYLMPYRKYLYSFQFSHSIVSNSLWPHGLWHAVFPVYHQLLNLAQTHVSVWHVGDGIQTSYPLLSLLLPLSIFPSIRVFFSESVLCIRWLKHWSFSFSISPSNEYSGLISFRSDWFDLLFNNIWEICCQLHAGESFCEMNKTFFQR